MIMRPGRIPFTSIDAYAARFRSGDIDDFGMLETLLRHLDDEYLAWAAEQNKTPER